MGPRAFPTNSSPCSASIPVRQDPTLGGSETFNSFLRKAQQVGRSCRAGMIRDGPPDPEWVADGAGLPIPAANPFSLQETQQIPTEEVVLEVLLSNGQKVKVTILTSDQTEDVLEVPELLCFVLAPEQGCPWEGPGERWGSVMPRSLGFSVCSPLSCPPFGRGPGSPQSAWAGSFQEAAG